MIPAQRSALDEIVVKMRSGRMTRRTFLERAIATGLTSSVAFSLLEACGGPSGGSGPTTIVWESEHNTTAIPVYTQLTDTFNKTNKDNIHVVYRSGPASTDQFRSLTVTMLRARSATTDVLSMDIIWPPEFAKNQWTVPLNSYWSDSERAKYLPGPIQGCTFDGKVWAAPMRTDAGLIYYRKDLVPTPPTTWDELISAAQQATGQKKTTYGYVWQGKEYEGMVCNFVELLYSYGGSVLDPNDPKKVVVNSPQGQQALAKMVSMVGTISPPAVTTYIEDDSLNIWRNGDSAFLRHWITAYKPSSDPKSSKIAEKFDVHPMLSGGNGLTGHPTIGGWNFGINAFSSPDKQNAAWKFIQYMISEEAQKQFALNTSISVTHASIYDDPDIKSKVPLLARIKTNLQSALPRPVSSAYPDITRAMQIHVHQALGKQVSPTAALTALQADLEKIVAK